MSKSNSSSNAAGNKRKYDTFVEPSTTSSEWVIEGADATTYILTLLKLSHVSKDSYILIPGCGISLVPKLLYDEGYTHLYIIDIEDRSIVFQNDVFGNNKDVIIKKHDILNDVFSSGTMFDVIIDKSFMDVFLRQSYATLAWNNTIKMLKPNGVYITLSMFHKKWKRYASKKTFSEIKYGSVAIKKYSSRTRPTIASFSHPACILACILKDDNNNNKESDTVFEKSFTISTTPFSDLHSIPSHSFPNDSSMF